MYSFWGQIFFFSLFAAKGEVGWIWVGFDQQKKALPRRAAVSVVRSRGGRRLLAEDGRVSWALRPSTEARGFRRIGARKW